MGSMMAPSCSSTILPFVRRELPSERPTPTASLESLGLVAPTETTNSLTECLLSILAGPAWSLPTAPMLSSMSRPSFLPKHSAHVLRRYIILLILECNPFQIQVYLEKNL